VTYFRLRNIGKKVLLATLMSFLILIPIINFWVLIPGLAAQEGYEDTQELDNIGKVVNAILFVLIGVSALVFVASLFFYRR
jgi:hypothetical protein